MKLTIAALLAVAASASGDVSKVVGLLETMLQKGKDDKQAEAIQYAKYNAWCVKETTVRKADLKKLGQHIETVTADIKLAQAEAKTRGEEIQALEQEIAGWNGEKDTDSAARKKAKTVYTASNEEYAASIEALGNAVKAVRDGRVNQKEDAKKVEEKAEEVAALLQLPESNSQLAKITAFLSENMGQKPAPESVKGKYKSGTQNVQNLLENLQDKFKDEQLAANKEELKQADASKALQARLDVSIKSATETKANKVASKAGSESLAADKTAELEDSISTKGDDEKFLDNLQTTCEQKTSDFQKRTALRDGELVVVAEAINLLSKGAVKATASRAALLQKTQAGLITMLRSSVVPKEQQRAAIYLRQMSKQLGSDVLAKLAMEADKDPLARVKEMVDKLIAKLAADTGLDEQAQKWCDSEMPANEKARTKGNAAVEKLNNQLDAAKLDVADLSKQITDLTDSLAANAKSYAEATKTRGEEKAANLLTIKDAKEAQEAISSALTQLKAYYEKAAENTALVQTSATKLQQQPDIFGEAYVPTPGAESNVLTLIEEVLQDYSNLEQSTITAEQTATDEYDELTKDMRILKAQQDKDLKHSQTRKGEEEQNIATFTQSLATADKELAATMKYYAYIKDKCDMSGGAVEKRQARIKQEMATLEKAKKLLNQEEIDF
eukprot:TRINITY_DN47739_c0_g1_i1.p1 TRINITY_DN47739_c0_g1~~TRINITY_DN47739_c0_g1_i1.p1  ORF type:complete len:670 (+),score=219.44 TRINITY_DN47739_c0_g1_i1:77-2086(+)